MTFKDHKAISLFSGVGGLDFGFEAAGFSTMAALDFEPTVCSTVRANRPNWKIMEGDIHKFSTSTILEHAQLSKDNVAIVFGGPPCQPFSKSSYWVRGDSLRLSDPRASTLSEFIRVIDEVLPPVFLLENVQGLNYKNKNEGFKLIIDGIQEINKKHSCSYQVSHAVLNAADYGVPQLRERIFIIGNRLGKKFTFPSPTHFPASDDLSLLEKQTYMTAWDAIGDLENVTNGESLKVGGKWGDLLPTIPEGKNYLWHTERGGGARLFGWRTRYWSFLLKLSKTLPSWTIQAQPGSSIGPFHWKNRKLSTKEMCRIQTFPDDISFLCNRTEVQRMIGNAVPSLLAEVLATEIKRQIFGEPVYSRYTLMPQRRLPLPHTEPVSELPQKYLPLIGEHPAHHTCRKEQVVRPLEP